MIFFRSLSFRGAKFKNGFEKKTQWDRMRLHFLCARSNWRNRWFILNWCVIYFEREIFLVAVYIFFFAHEKYSLEKKCARAVIFFFRKKHPENLRSSRVSKVISSFIHAGKCVIDNLRCSFFVRRRLSSSYRTDQFFILLFTTFLLLYLYSDEHLLCHENFSYTSIRTININIY